MNVLFQSAFLKALGWSLLDSLWQVGILWLVYVLLTANGKKFKSGQKHSLALFSLAGGAIWFLITLISHFYRLVDGAALMVNASDTSETGALAISITSLFSYIEPVLPFLSIAYLSAIVYLFVRLYRQYYITQKLFSAGLHKANPELRVFLKYIAARMGIKKEVSIWFSDLVDTPLTIGFWKPVILLPLAVINHLSIQQAEAIILHELNHIRRNDYFVNLLIACMDIILFFNPFVRILTHIIKNERENSCDDMVLQFRYDAGEYANALLLLEKNRIVAPALTMNATGRSKKLLLKRVERILNKKAPGTAINQKLVAYVLSALLIGLIGFYNPGKVIVKTIDSAQNVPATDDTEMANFSTPEIAKDEIIEKPHSIVQNQKVNRTSPVSEKSDATEEDQNEEIIDWISDEMPIEMETSEVLTPLISYAGSAAEVREFSIPENNIQIQPNYHVEVHPYVPSTSFLYNVVEDTLMPKRYIPTPAEIKAKEAMTSALRALQEIDWQKLEKEMSAAGKKIDVIKLQQELKKAMSEVDWKKINEEIESSLMQAENELLKEHADLHSELKKFQHQHQAKLAERQRVYKAIIHDRLCEDKQQERKPIKRKIDQKKKIVHI